MEQKYHPVPARTMVIEEHLSIGSCPLSIIDKVIQWVSLQTNPRPFSSGVYQFSSLSPLHNNHLSQKLVILTYYKILFYNRYNVAYKAPRPFTDFVT